MLHITRSVRVLLHSELFKCFLSMGILVHHSKDKTSKSHDDDVSMQKSHYDVTYLFWSLELCFDNWWLFTFKTSTMSYHFNNFKMTSYVELVSASNRHQANSRKYRGMSE